MKISSEKNTRAKPLDKKFWSAFSKSIWQKKAVAYKNLQSPLRQIDATRIFKMLVEYSDLCRKRKSAEGFKLYLEGERQHDLDTLQFLPVKKDLSLIGYHKRMQAMFPDYCLVCDELLQVSLESFGLLTDFIKVLYQHIGFPNRFSELGLYLGNYQKTPFGVHLDGCGVFSFPAVGTKKFRIWSPEFVSKNSDLVEAHQYDKFKKHSQVLVANPCDMTYWPSQAWHIAESDGSFSATWSLGVWVDRAHKDVVSQTMNSLFATKLGKLAEQKTIMFQSLHNKTGEVKALPELYQQTVSALQNISDTEIQDSFLKAWLALTSRQGLKNFPTVKGKQKLTAKDLLKNRLPSPILWSQLSDKKQYCFAFDGQLFLHPASAKLVKLIEDLNSGHNCKISDYLNGPTASKDLQLLQQLCNTGAFSAGCA